MSTSPPISAQRSLMIWEQLVKRGIRDQRVLEAMGKVERERFVSPDKVAVAYQDHAIAIGYNQTISQPYMVALTLEALEIDEEHRVLEVGTGSGYMTALLCELAREVVSVEIVPELAAQAEARLRGLGYSNFQVAVADGTKGYPPRAPYHRIAVAAGGPRVPSSLEDQLDAGGILVIPIGDRDRQVLRKVQRSRGEFLEEDLCPCVYVPLVGEEGWPDRESG